MSKFRVRAIGQITDDSGTYVGAALEGDVDAVKALGRVYGRPVAIVPADLLDEAEKALAGAEAHIVMMYRGINPHANYDDEVTMRGSVSGSRLADKDEMVIGLRATLARIRGEKA